MLPVCTVSDTPPGLSHKSLRISNFQKARRATPYLWIQPEGDQEILAAGPLDGQRTYPLDNAFPDRISAAGESVK